MGSHESAQVIQNWLSSHDIHSTTTFDGGFVRAAASLNTWAPLVGAEFYSFTSQSRPDVTVYRSMSSSVITAIGQHLEFIGDLTSFPQIRSTSGPVLKKVGASNDVSPQLL